MDLLPGLGSATLMIYFDCFRMKNFYVIQQLGLHDSCFEIPAVRSRRFVELTGIKMGFGIVRVIAPVVLLLSFSFNFGSVNAQTIIQTPQQILEAAKQASLDGDYKTALSKSRKAKSLAGSDLNFAVSYLTAMTSIADLSDRRHRTAVFNEALKAANEIETSKIADGTQDAELAWNYMVGIEKLATALEGTSNKTCRKLYLAQAKVAYNLKTNPGFPADSQSHLANYLMGGAYGRAIEKDEKKTIAAVQMAIENGFTDFESLLENEFVKELKSEKVNKLISHHFRGYKQKLKTWAHDSIAAFPARKFKFDVADIETGRIRHGDYRGRILVLDLWATWCPPCREAIPHFVKLDEEFRKENVDVVGISMDSPDDPSRSLKVVRRFIDKNGVEYAVAMGNRSVMNQLAPGQKLPTVLFIDTQGQIRYIAEGPHNYYQLEAITNALVERENESPTSMSAANGM